MAGFVRPPAALEPSGELGLEPVDHRIERGLRLRYQEYCQRQASGLLELVPKETVRPLYRAAREWASSGGLHESKDPMATLVRYCRQLLPLPPFECWLEDYEQNRIEHLRYVSEGPLYARAAEPVMVDVREMSLDGEEWTAGLSLYSDGSVWRGFITFRKSSSEQGLRTTNIFCEEDPKDVRNRFMDLTLHALQGFLRSTLP